mmetsp:Transcript_119528/g.373888  ORF Transcript_119528/g.373888 Transcript_119528/m.373888 type:complete len:123 (+) Transcript_119528:642-1010(+)
MQAPQATATDCRCAALAPSTGAATAGPVRAAAAAGAATPAGYGAGPTHASPCQSRRRGVVAHRSIASAGRPPAPVAGAAPNAKVPAPAPVLVAPVPPAPVPAAPAVAGPEALAPRPARRPSN